MSVKKIQILFDLHLEHSDFSITSTEQKADIVILAGDIASSNKVGQMRLRDLLAKLCGDCRNVVMIAGNHEFYGTDIDDHLKNLRDLSREYSNLTFLECETAIVQGLTISGCTLWTDFSLENSGNGGIRAEACISDFLFIRHAGRPIIWQDMVDRFQQAVKFLRNHAPASDIVITHFLPSPRSIAVKHVSSNLNSYFACDLSDLISRVNGLWVHGHTHSSCDYIEGKCRVVCNPRGYGRENHEFNPGLVVSLDRPPISGVSRS